MKIKRTVDSKEYEIELTVQEGFAAYREWLHDMCVEDINVAIDHFRNNGWFGYGEREWVENHVDDVLTYYMGFFDDEQTAYDWSVDAVNYCLQHKEEFES